MIDFFRKIKIIKELKKITEKADKTDREDYTGVPFSIRRNLLLGAIAEKNWWGLYYKIKKDTYKNNLIAKYTGLLRELEAEGVVNICTQNKIDEEIASNLGLNNGIHTPIGGYAVYKKENHISIKLVRPTYCNFSNSFERFLREFVGIIGILLALFGAIWGSPYLLIIKNYIQTSLCSLGIDIMCI